MNRKNHSYREIQFNQMEGMQNSSQWSSGGCKVIFYKQWTQEAGLFCSRILHRNGDGIPQKEQVIDYLKQGRTKTF